VSLFFLVPLLVVVVFARIELRPAAPPALDKSSLRDNWQAAIDAFSSSGPHRTVFPYSVIPGGVRDSRELTAAIKDPVVARHYSDFRLARARSIRLDRPRAMYVSYRLDGRVYWTHNPMMIPAGEALISDGENLARERCGNRLSPVPKSPVLANEPSPEKLENADFIPPLLADLVPAESADPVPQFVATPVGGAPASLPAAGVFLVVPPQGAPTSAAAPPPVATPEPGSLTLLLGGGLLLGLGCAVLSRDPEGRVEIRLPAAACGGLLRGVCRRFLCSSELPRVREARESS
jgi:hypothetical protein